MISSATDAGISTTDDSPITLLSFTTIDSVAALSIVLVNEGPTPGFFSFDGENWARLSAGSQVEIPDHRGLNLALQVKRVPGGENLMGVFAYAL